MLSLGSESKCDVCLDAFDNDASGKSPSSIACGHVFCIQCLNQLSRQVCPVCRQDFSPSDIVKLHVESEPAEVHRLQGILLHFADNGASEAELRSAMSEFRQFLRPHPRPQFDNLRICMKMMNYILTLKTRAIELEQKSGKVDQLSDKKRVMKQTIEELRIEVGLLKNEKEVLEQEKNVLERDQEEAERKNVTELQRIIDTANSFSKKSRILTEQNLELRQEIRRLKQKAHDDKDLGSVSLIHKSRDKEPPLVSEYMISPLAEFTGHLPHDGLAALPELDDPALVEKVIRLEILSPCGSNQHPYNCSCVPPGMGRGRSGSLSSFTQSSISSTSTNPLMEEEPHRAPSSSPHETASRLARPSGLSLTAPSPAEPEETTSHVESPPPTVRKSHRKHKSVHVAKAPAPADSILHSSGREVAPSLNVDPVVSDAESNTGTRNHRQLRTRLASLLADPNASPEESSAISSSMPNMTNMPGGSYFPPVEPAAPRNQDHDSMRSTASKHVKRSGLQDAFSPAPPHRSNGTPVHIPSALSYNPPPYGGSPGVSSSLPRTGTGISNASDAAKRVREKVASKTPRPQDITPGSSASSSAAAAAAAAGNTWGSSSRYKPTSASPKPVPMPIPGSSSYDRPSRRF